MPRSTRGSGPEQVRFDGTKLKTITLGDYAVRFGFGALVSTIAGFVATLFGYRVGGLFLAFPAILPATLTLIEKRDGVRQALADVHAATIGSVAMVAFAVITVLVLHVAPAFALPAALAGWVVLSLAMFAGFRELARRR